MEEVAHSLGLPIWSKPERATGGSSFAAFATHGKARRDYKRTTRYCGWWWGRVCVMAWVGEQ